MARNLILRSFVFRRVIENRFCPLYSHRRLDSFGTLIFTYTTTAPSPPSKSFTNPSLYTTGTITSPQLSLLPPFRHSHSFCSPSGPSNIVLVKTDEEFNSILNKVQGRFISPVIGELSEKYPHVTTYKIDIDQAAIRGTLGKLLIRAVPTLHFFQNGKKADELIGADIGRLKSTMEKLFKKD